MLASGISLAGGKLGGPLTRCAGYGNGREIPEAREAVGSGG
jgi:hypothetical protein